MIEKLKERLSFGNKGISNVTGIMMTLVVATILIVVYTMVQSVGATTLNSLQNTTTYGGFAWNATQTGLVGITTMSQQNNLIVTIIVMAAVIAILVGAFLYSFMRGKGGGY